MVIKRLMCDFCEKFQTIFDQKWKIIEFCGLSAQNLCY